MKKEYEVQFHDETNGYKARIAVVQLDVDTSFTYYEDIEDPKKWGSELYIGSNYNVDSKKKSYSRNYKKWKNLPEKYKDLASDLKEIHSLRYN